jgi:hypothetical protein
MRYVRHVLVLFVLVFATMMWPVSSADAHVWACGSSNHWEFEHASINYITGSSVTGDYATAVSNAAGVWSFTTIIDFVPGLFDVGIDVVSLPPGVVGSTSWSTSGCSMYGAQVKLATAISGDGAAKIQAVVAHEFGHVAGLDHEPGGATCSPESLMLSNINWFWNGTCQWNGPRPHDGSTISFIYA